MMSDINFGALLGGIVAFIGVNILGYGWGIMGLAALICAFIDIIWPHIHRHVRRAKKEQERDLAFRAYAARYQVPPQDSYRQPMESAAGGDTRPAAPRTFVPGDTLHRVPRAGYSDRYPRV